MTCRHCEQAELERQDDSLHCYKCGCVVYPQNNMADEMEVQKQIIKERGLGRMVAPLPQMSLAERRRHDADLKREWRKTNAEYLQNYRIAKRTAKG